MSAAARPGVSLHRGADVVHAAAMSFALTHHLTTSSPAPHHHQQQQLAQQALEQEALEQQGCTVADDRLSLNHHALASPPPHDIPLSLRPAVKQTSVYTVCRLSVKHYTNNTRAFQFAIRIDSIRFVMRIDSNRFILQKNRPFDSLVVMQFLH